MLLVPVFLALVVTAPDAPPPATLQLEQHVRTMLAEVHDNSAVHVPAPPPHLAINIQSGDANRMPAARWTPVSCTGVLGCQNVSRDNIYGFVHYAATSVLLHSQLYTNLTSRLPKLARLVLPRP